MDAITSISITGTGEKDFSETNTCGKRVKAGASCTITVTFTPSVDGKHCRGFKVSDLGDEVVKQLTPPEQ